MACLKGLDFKVIQKSLAKPITLGFVCGLFWNCGVLVQSNSLESDAGTNGTPNFKFQFFGQFLLDI
jgi:hypothetical protein